MGFLGIEIGGTKIQAVVVSASGAVGDRVSGVVHAEAGAAAVLETLGRQIGEVLTICPESIEGVGVGFGGPVDRSLGVIAASHQVAGWGGFPLAAWVANRVPGIPVVLENDANAAAFGEAILGAGRGCRTVFYANSGSGVGAGFVIEGRIYHGRAPGEMEFGHLRMSIDGPTVEEVASGWSLDRQVRAAVEADPRGGLAVAAAAWRPSARLLGPALAAGDAEAATILGRAARAYALGLSHAVHLLNPDTIVLGGGVAGIGEPWRAAVAGHLEGFLIGALRPAPPVRLAVLGDLVVPIGAALLARAGRA